MKSIIIQAYTILVEALEQFVRLPQLVPLGFAGGSLAYSHHISAGPESSTDDHYPSADLGADRQDLPASASMSAHGTGQRSGKAQDSGSRSAPGKPGQYSTSLATEQISSQPYTIIREVLWSCKVISLSFIGAFIVISLIWIFGWGQPDKLLNLPIGIYQGFHCGWSVAVADPWTCDK